MTHPLSSSLSSPPSPSPSHSPGPSRSYTHHVPSAFPLAGSVAPATFTPASAHASSPSHASTHALNPLSAPHSARAASVQQPPLPPPSPSPPPPTATATATAAGTVASFTETATPAQPPIAPAAQALASAPAPSNPKVLPYLFDDAQLEDVLVLVVDMLVKLTEHNDSLPLHPSALTRFHSRATPNISLSAYLRRIAKYTSVEKCCILILLVYIDRVCERLQGFTICGLTVHRFICAAILCASKALCDAFNTNEHYAKVGGISLAEINLLEKEFLQIIDWHLICSGSVLQHYYASLVRSHNDYVLAQPNQQPYVKANLTPAGTNVQYTSFTS
ncbi:related to PHO80 - cyclin [Ustilago trichophora]|uniref:Related to PHO80 - cyclin n=1 Tax=Ustilago trichophora TaxID=86804 RepID=A0A5C3DVH8_9BASI|nr:related to PHO80 - cyclin [Ustilago trichophora]